MTGVTVVTAPRARDLGGDTLEGIVSRDLVDLTERLVKNGQSVSHAGYLGGEFGYGCHFKNDVFVMRPFCWCELSSCATCEDQSSEPGDPEHVTPHFAVAGTPIEVRWYKWIGRSMEIGPADLTVETWREAFDRAIASVGVRR